MLQEFILQRFIVVRYVRAAFDLENQLLFFRETEVFMLHEMKLFVDHDDAYQENNGNGELHDDHDFSETIAFRTRTHFTFECHNRFERREKNRGIAAGKKSHKQKDEYNG